MKLLQDLHLLLTFDKVQNPLRLPRKTTSQPSKVVRTSGALCILNWKCASRHNSVQLFSTSARQKVVRACGVFNILTWKATTACNFSTSQLSKVVWDRQFLTLLTWRCASRHTGVHFFDISSSKSAPTLVCFVHDLEMCFVAPSQHGVLCLFLLRNVLRATTAYTFSTSRLLELLRS